MSKIEFPDGEFFSCSDVNEHLSSTNPIEAIAEFVESYLSPDCDTAEVIREDIVGVTVYAFNRAKVGERELSEVAASLSERAAEFWNENYTGPDGEFSIDDKEIAAFAEEILPALAKLYKREPWLCEQVGSIDLSAEQLEALMRQECPNWFAKGGQS